MRVDLITGFLGAGKTTFLKKYVSYLKGRGERLRIIENEFCAWGVDTHFLEDTHEDIRDLSGHCMCCTGKEMFVSMLLEAAAAGCDRVLVEPSGIYDVDEFFQVMGLSAVAACCEIGSIITVVDAGMPGEDSEDNDYLMLTQLLAAGCILISKSTLYDEGRVQEAMRGIGNRLAPYLMEGGEPMIVCRDWETLEDEDMAALDGCGYRRPAHKRKYLDHAALYETCMLAARCDDEADLEQKLTQLFADESSGKILRVKGYVKDGAGQWYAVNCTPGIICCEPCDIRRGLCVVIGQKLDEAGIKKILAS